ncbi:MAG: type II toxin-antitoxin system VapC family toxin [Acidobacteria bacterium]|nr:type II toxin-antitoxin system VapC family toxin [Acidobacteriota bacterium]MBV9144479.1 type II toxin-antitoxin system VapC family toxin [Acidobacteriota bacterium]
MIFIDSNVPMYLVGSAHPHKLDAQRLLAQLAGERRRLVTDAEVMQEILHRCVAINRRDAIQPTFDVLLSLVDEVFAIERATAERAKQIVLAYPRVSAREAIHVAVMENHGINTLLSFDRGFETIPGLRRLG